MNGRPATLEEDAAFKSKANGEDPGAQVRNALDWKTLADGAPPPRDWVIKHWLAMGHITGLMGMGGVGKSLLAQQIGCCIALHRPILDEVPRGRTVLMWNCEDDHDELWRRGIAIAQWLEVDLSKFAGRFILESRLGRDNTLFASEFDRPMFTPLLGELTEQANDYDAEVVILDNAAQLFGGNENNRHHVTKFLNGLCGALPGRAILLPAHPSRQVGSEYSGNSAWENTMRLRLYLGDRLPDEKTEEEPTDHVRYLAKRKANYTSKDWRRFTYRDGVLIPDAVEQGAALLNGLRHQRAARVVLDAAARLKQMDVRATDGPSSPQFLPKVILAYKLNEGCSKGELADAMREAMLNGKLIRAVVGRYSNRSQMYGLIPA